MDTLDAYIGMDILDAWSSTFNKNYDPEKKGKNYNIKLLTSIKY